jgi:hypothetical protein
MSPARRHSSPGFRAFHGEFSSFWATNRTASAMPGPDDACHIAQVNRTVRSRSGQHVRVVRAIYLRGESTTGLPGSVETNHAPMPSGGVRTRGCGVRRARQARANRRWRLGPVGGFRLRGRAGVAVIPFPVPAASHAACGFAELRAHLTTLRQGYRGRSSRKRRLRRPASNSVLFEEAERPIESHAFLVHRFQPKP